MGNNKENLNFQVKKQLPSSIISIRKANFQMQSDHKIKFLGHERSNYWTQIGGCATDLSEIGGRKQ